MGNAQLLVHPDTIKITNELKIQVKLLSSDSLCSAFFMAIPGEVKLHYHAFHSENVMVVDGRGLMKLGNTEFEIKKGDLIVIPKGTTHAVKNTGSEPLKVISIQSPSFDGLDRVWVD